MTSLRIVWLWLFVACVPRVDPGPVPVDEAKKPVQIIEFKDETSPNIYLQAVIKAGSAHDPIGREGLAYLTAQSLVHGGSGSVSAEELRKTLYPTGNAIEVFVEREHVSVRLKCHRDHADRCIDTFMTVLTQPDFNNTDVTRIREEALYEVTDGILADEEQLGHEVLHSFLFEAHPYGRPVYGRAGTIPTLTDAQCRTFYAANYLRATTRFGIGGAYSDEQLERVQAGLQRLGDALAPDDAQQAPLSVQQRRLLIVQTETPVTGFHIGHTHDVDRTHEDWPALYLATLALGAHRQSYGRLFETLRTQRGLNYGDYAYIEAFRQRGWSTYPEQGALIRQPIFYLWLRPTGIDNGPFSLKLAIDELEKWVNDGLEPSEFETVKAYALGHLPLEAQNIERQLTYALDANISGTPNLLKSLPQRLQSLTLEETNAAIQRHIRPEHLSIVAVSGDRTLADSVTGTTPTPITYANVTPSVEQTKRDDDIAKKSLELSKDQTTEISASGIFR